MADRKISELTNITGANLADDDEFALVDTSADETKAITFGEFKTALDTATGFVRITGDTMTGNLNMGDNVKAIFGAGSDLQIYHDGSNSFIKDAGTGNLLIQSDANTGFQNASGTEWKVEALTDGAVNIYYNGSQKLATTSTGISITGNATFADNGKAIFGAGGDLEIYHSGFNSFIDEVGTGYLQIRASDNITLKSAADELYVNCVNNGAVTLYYDNAAKLATGSTGIDVTGTVFSDNLHIEA